MTFRGFEDVDATVTRATARGVGVRFDEPIDYVDGARPLAGQFAHFEPVRYVAPVLTPRRPATKTILFAGPPRKILRFQSLLIGRTHDMLACMEYGSFIAQISPASELGGQIEKPRRVIREDGSLSAEMALHRLVAQFDLVHDTTRTDANEESVKR